MAFLYVCGLSSMRSGLWDKCQEFLRKVNRDLGQLISRSRSIGKYQAQVLQCMSIVCVLTTPVFVDTGRLTSKRMAR
ncbi:SCAI protein, partial [Polyodon spathula]|nr:SCAI protein [Polyodon spathula]